MPLEPHEPRRLGFGDELLLQLLVGKPQRDVHPRPAVPLDGAAEEVGVLVDHPVNDVFLH